MLYCLTDNLWAGDTTATTCPLCGKSPNHSIRDGHPGASRCRCGISVRAQARTPGEPQSSHPRGFPTGTPSSGKLRVKAMGTPVGEDVPEQGQQHQPGEQLPNRPRRSNRVKISKCLTLYEGVLMFLPRYIILFPLPLIFIFHFTAQ